MKQTILLIAAVLVSGFASVVNAQNPIVQTCFTTDPAPMVHGDRLYVFTGHDEEGADFFWMNDWRLFSTTDMVNWTDHGNPARECDFKWADDRAWAAQCIERNGKFYLYVPVHSKLSGGMAIGVAVADKVTGPYHDALGKPLYEDGKWDHIDPTVFIDNDGQAYIYWGNPRLYSAKLNEDMISFASEVKCDTTVQRYTEGPWIAHSQKKGQYIMMYAAGGVPECIAYSVSKKPQGPWQYVGEIMSQTNDTKSFTNHSGFINFKGHDYFFYHTGWLPGGGGFGRSVSVEEFAWQKDGKFPKIVPTREGVRPIGTLNPYMKVEGETMAFSKGLHTEWNSKQQRIWVSDIHNGDWQKMREVDFGEKAPYSIELVAASALQGGKIEVRLDSLKGQIISTVEVSPTGGWEEWETFSAPVKTNVTGIHDLYFIYKGMKGCKLFNLDSWTMKKKESVADFYATHKVLNYDDGKAAAGEMPQPEQFDPNFHIYLCFGQSNMEGNAKIEPQDRQNIDTRFCMMAGVDMNNTGRKKGQWYVAVPPLCREWTGLTPADYFGRKMVASLPQEVKVGVINVAVGGANIDLFDEDKCADNIANAADWYKNFCKSYNNNPYRELINLAKKAQKVGVIKGILLHQGCTNNGQKDWPQRVKLVYERMLNELNLKAEDVPLLVGELMTQEDGGCCYAHNAIIDNIQETIPTAHVVKSLGCPGAPDKLHFTAEGYRILGQRYADVMLPLLK